ncbi:hypothetical protein TRFO_29618 [Tritrichomonas foetus]|uniref:Protein kinase domain-containing protein n=1 Tax=Tritrichomonas foetus TaxID=1144522 RepID=A0A1J4JVL7_9EUKA|nr:hypothetical protein TRFO_29618 [Tritrichomonas foetus]|eukprot:OHT03059.1 hypothetical protein TRFO_29618 [Tritrichomonas foetus]
MDPPLKSTFQQHGYEIESQIGTGGFSSIYLIYSLRYHQHFAAKVVSLANLTQTSTFESNDSDNIDDSCYSGANFAQKNIETEVQALIGLNHPNIIKMYEFFKDDRYLYIVFDYCLNGSLLDEIDAHGFIPEPRLTKVFLDICKALRHCHIRNVAHHDIKPANVLVDKYHRCVLADFGLSQTGRISRDTMGSRVFMAPEQISVTSKARMNPRADSPKDENNQNNLGFSDEDKCIVNKKDNGDASIHDMCSEKIDDFDVNYQNGHYDPMKADIWSLGVTLYMMSTGDVPWPLTSIEDLDEAILNCKISYPQGMRPELAQLITKMLTVDPNKRPTIDDVFRIVELNEINRQAAKLMPKVGSHRKVGPIPMALSLGSKRLIPGFPSRGSIHKYLIRKPQITQVPSFEKNLISIISVGDKNFH